MRRLIGRQLRKWVDRLDAKGAPRYTGFSFTMEPGKGVVFHQDDLNTPSGTSLWYLGEDEYAKAHDPASFSAEPIAMSVAYALKLLSTVMGGKPLSHSSTARNAVTLLEEWPKAIPVIYRDLVALRARYLARINSTYGFDARFDETGCLLLTNEEIESLPKTTDWQGDSVIDFIELLDGIPTRIVAAEKRGTFPAPFATAAQGDATHALAGRYGLVIDNAGAVLATEAAIATIPEVERNGVRIRVIPEPAPLTQPEGTEAQ